MWGRLREILFSYAWLIGGVALLFAVYLLPPDTSLSEVERTGTLTACLPPSRPPLVTEDPTAPGLEVELLEEIAREMGLRFRAVTVPAMGADFDPSLWRITRAHCAVIGGGTLDTVETRAFLSVTQPFAETGWVVIAKSADEAIGGKRAAVLANIPGADRLTLSRFLRDQDVSVSLVRTADDLTEALANGAADIGIADALFAQAVAGDIGFVTQDLPPPFRHEGLVFGLWKGDLTLKRAITGALQRIKDDGRLTALQAKYLDL